MHREPLQAGLAFLDSWLGYRARQLDLPGYVVSIAHEDAVVFSRAYGLANLKRHTPLQTNHLFAMASQSKMFTAVAILQLFERGLLQLDSLVCTYVPWLAGHPDSRAKEITIRQLLSHSAGLTRDGRDMAFLQPDKPFPDEAALRETFIAADLVFDPNTHHKYSNLGFALLGQVIAAVSRESYAAYVQKHIIAALDLPDTSPDFTPALRKRLPTGYGVPFDGVRPELGPRKPAAALKPAMGIHATTEDMCRFTRALFLGDERLLSDQSKREMQRTAWRVPDGFDSGLETGLGLAVQHIGDRRVVGHTAHLLGHTSATFFDPYDQWTVAVAGNCKDLPIMEMVRGIFETLDWFTAEPDIVTPPKLARFRVRACGPTAIVDIVAAGSRLAAADPDDWEPFTWCEELTLVDATTLRITTQGSAQSEGELIGFTFRNKVVRTVQYGGVTLVPEADYRQQLARQNHKK